jgi:hypothetical protein
MLLSYVERLSPGEQQQLWTRRPVTTDVVLSNRKSGPERVLDIAAARVKGPGDHIEELISKEELEAVSTQYRELAGFGKKDRK